MQTWRRNGLLILAIWLFFWLALDSMVDDSPTMDEQNHLARGVAFVRTADPRLSLEHPPLTNALSGLPVALLLPELRLPTDHPSWERQPPDVYWYNFAEQFLWHYNADVTRMIFLGRLPIVFLTLGLALVGYRLAGALWGRPSAPVAFVLLLFDPNVLAHGRYITTDLGGTTFVLLATWLLWRMWITDYRLPITDHRSPFTDHRLPKILLAGLGMGLAFGSKLSALAFVPIWGALALLPLYGAGERRSDRRAARAAGRRLLHFLLAGIISVGVVWALFGFEWRAFHFQSEWLAGLNGVNGPMPTFWAGVEQIALLTGDGRYDAFLLGQFSSTGFPLYFPIAFAMKTPLLTLALLVVALTLLLIPMPQKPYTVLQRRAPETASYRSPASGNGRTRRRALFLAIPAALYLLLSTQSSLNIGYRHLLPLLPFVYVLISGLARRSAEYRLPFTAYRLPLTVRHLPFTLLLLAHIGTAVLIHPHYLSFFNRAAGGPENGWRLLIDSNIDWGQDLLRLQQWMADNDVDSVKLGWFGTADPSYYGLIHEPLPGMPLPPYWSLWSQSPFNEDDPEPGIYAISVSSLWEIPRPVGQKYVYHWFRAREPNDRVGYSILIYDVR
ncbi:MAG: phospholipid carrier-dependent glycosyltransferase [Anaerolinea sp.]|nr:phospholipid carrier-dependent glycosyltransferase [Anaerolinea sp.]